jgi:hypothetical protein
MLKNNASETIFVGFLVSSFNALCYETKAIISDL